MGSMGKRASMQNKWIKTFAIDHRMSTEKTEVSVTHEMEKTFNNYNNKENGYELTGKTVIKLRDDLQSFLITVQRRPHNGIFRQ